MHKTAFALLVLATAATALPSAPTVAYTAKAPLAGGSALRLASSSPATTLRLKGGALPANDVLVKTAIGGAMGALIRSYLQNWNPEISRHGPWKHIVGINMVGATLLGIVTSSGFPKALAPMFIPCCRIISAIITVDAYNLMTSGKEVDGSMYFLLVVAANLLMNHVGRTIIAPRIF